MEIKFKQKAYEKIRETNQGWHWAKIKKIYENEGYIDEKGNSLLELGAPVAHPTLSAPRSRLLPRAFCDVTGFEAAYRDPKSKLRYADQGVYQFIRLRLEPQGATKKYRELRGEVTEIK